MNKKLISLTESDLHRIVKQSVNRLLREYYEGESYDGSLTVGELIQELQKCNPDADVEVYVGNSTFKSITNVDLNRIFLDGREYKEWKRKEEEALNEPRGNVVGDDYGEGFNY